MTKEQELKLVELIKQFCQVADECNLTMLDLVRIRDTYFPIHNGGRPDPASLAKSVKILEQHLGDMKSVLSMCGVKDASEPEIVGKKDAAKVQAAKTVMVPWIDTTALTTFVDGADLGGPKTKWKVRKLIEQGANGDALSKKDVEYLRETVKCKLTEDFLSKVVVK